jgi:hypothetical protein
MGQIRLNPDPCNTVTQHQKLNFSGLIVVGLLRLDGFGIFWKPLTNFQFGRY